MPSEPSIRRSAPSICMAFKERKVRYLLCISTHSAARITKRSAARISTRISTLAQLSFAALFQKQASASHSRSLLTWLCFRNKPEVLGALQMAQLGASSPKAEKADGDESFLSDMVSIKQRYPNLKGLLLYKKVVEHWQMPGVTRINFYDKLDPTSATKHKLLHRHPVNLNRGQDGTLQQYKSGVLKYGVLPHCRGCAIAVPRPTSNVDTQHEFQSYWLVGHTTLTESVYMAVDEEPSNEQVVASIEQGLPDPLVLSPRTPKDVLLWIKDEHNRWHVGAGMTVLEYMENSQDASSGWLAELNRMQKKSRDFPTCGKDTYRQTMQDFILAHYDTFKKWQHYQDCSSFVNNMKIKKLYDKLVKSLTKQGEFLNVKVNNATVVHNFHKLYNCIMGSEFVSVHVEDHLAMFLMEALSMCFPLRDDPDRYIIADFLGNKVEGFNAPMKGSAVHKSLQRKNLVRASSQIGETVADEHEATISKQYKEQQTNKSNATKRKAEVAAQDGNQTPLQKQARIKEEKTNIKKSDKALKGLERTQAQNASLELVSEQMGEGETMREKMWLDDAIACVFGPLTKVASARQDQAVVQEMVRTILVFAFQGKVTFGGSQHLKWSSLRKAVRSEIIRVHKHVSGALPGISDPSKATSAEVADALSKMLDEAPPEPVVLDSSPDEALVLEMTDNSIFLEELGAFLTETNLKRPAQFHKVLQETIASLFDSLSNARNSTSQELIAAVLSQIYSIVNVQWLSFIGAVSAVEVKMLPEQQQQQIKQLIPEEDLIEKLTFLRSTYILEALKQLSVGENRVTKVDFKDAFIILDKCKADINAMDFFFVKNDLVMISDAEMNRIHISTWVSLLDHSLKCAKAGKFDETDELVAKVKKDVSKLVAPFKPVAVFPTEAPTEAPTGEATEKAASSGDSDKPTKTAPQLKVEESKSVSDMLKVVSAGATPVGSGPTLMEATPSSLKAFELSLKTFLYKTCMAQVGGSTLTDCGYFSLHEMSEGHKKSIITSSRD